MIVPLQKDDALLADIGSTGSATDRVHVWWLGQSGFLVRWGGHGLLFDPYLSDSLTRKYDGTDKPHVRMTELALDPRHLHGVEVVTSSHIHTDHLDAETLLALKSANPELTLVLPEANLDFARDRLGAAGPALMPVDAGTRVQVGPFEIHGITAAHNEVELDDQGHSRFLGFVVTFGGFTIYHSGDTLWHGTLIAEVARWKPDLAFLPINGNRPERRVAGNLNGLEAAAVARAIGAGLAIPCHYHQFEFNTEEPDEFINACGRLDQPCRVLQCGERLTLDVPPPGSREEVDAPPEADGEGEWWT